MKRLPRLDALRPANFLLLLAFPFLVWLFLTSTDYSRSFAAIIGVESGSANQLPGFLLFATLFAATLAATLTGRQSLFLVSLAAGLTLTVTMLGQPFLAASLAEAATSNVSRGLPIGLTLANALLFGLSRKHGLARRGLLVLNGVGLAGLFLFAHLGFATGLAVAVRAGVTAYILASILALIWVGLMQLRLSRRSLPLFLALAVAALALSGSQFLQPHIPVALIGDASGTVGITVGTPAQVVDAIRHGSWPDAPETDPKIRTVLTAEEGIAQLQSGKLSGVVLPSPLAPTALILWQTEVLPDAQANLGITALVLGIALLLLTVCGWIYHRHPLSIAAEFLIDTLRGIPMLVIILYIGLPLAGVLKSSTNGFLDPPNLLRGITAMAIAYSAYMAEIFRAGINAVPTGQIEAARSLGLTRWQTARHVILPQAFRIVIPPMGNEFIAILKDTSLLSILSIRDLTQRMREFQSATFLTFAPYNTVAIIYVFLTLIAASLVARVEHRFRNHQR